MLSGLPDGVTGEAGEEAAVERPVDPVALRAERVGAFLLDRAAGDLRSAEIGANILLLEPFDPVAYERTRIADGLVLVAVSQCAVDRLTGSGREPAQAESLMTWLAENEHAWRA